MNIYMGAKGDRVRQLQEQLQAKGFDPGSIDGVFGDRTRRALIGYQQSANLEPDGVLGPMTRASLGLKIDAPAVPKSRSQFRQLILSNPNYFGTLKGSSLAAVATQAGNTDFEELICVGYQPQLDRLVAIVEIKQMAGYGGPLCGSGSAEYLRFFIDWNSDGRWIDAGATRIVTHDIPEPGSLYHAVHIPLLPTRRGCKSPFMPRVRAILSWNDMPPIGDPEYLPPWGNALDATIQIQARPPWVFEAIPGLSNQLVEQINANIEGVIQQQAMIFGEEILSSQTLPQQIGAFAQAKVPALRYAAGLLDQLGKTKSSNEIAQLAPMIEEQLGIQSIGALLEEWFEPGDGNQSYEELRCVGYDRERQSLSAIVRIKQGSGYSGDLCSQGSHEYVSFWVWDENDLAWARVGAASVPVHDLPMPEGGVDYEVFLPVDFTRYQKPCNLGYTTLRIRAILSWNSVVTHHNQVPYWGGREEVSVVLKPGPQVAVGMQMPFLDSVGDMGVCSIDQSTGLADGPGVTTAGVAESAPFGGTITITGFFSNPPSTLSGAKPKYRISVRPYEPTIPDTANPWQPLANDFRITVATSIAGGVAYQSDLSQTIDSDGYYTYQEVFGPGEWRVVTGRVLGKWVTDTPHGVYQVRLEGKDALGSLVATGLIVCEDGSSRQTVHIHLDNERPRAELRITGVIRQGTTTTIPAGDCEKFYVGDRLVGAYVATDMHYGRASLSLQPSPIPSPPAPVAIPRMIGVDSYAGGLNPYGEPGGLWELDTTNMRACGYTLRLDVVDRTIVNSSTVNHWRMPATVGFSLELPPE